MNSRLASLATSLSTRRRFLQTTLAGGVSLAMMTRPGAAAEPVKRTAKPNLKLSLAAYSFNSFLQGGPNKAATMTLDDFIKLCADWQLDGTELTQYYFPKDFGPDYVIHLKALAFRLGLTISGTAIRNDFAQMNGPKRDESIASVKTWIDHSAALGAPVMRIFAGDVPKDDSPAGAIQRTIEGINACLPHAEQKGVCLGLENHGGITAKPQDMLQIIKGVKESPWFGVNFDGGGFTGDDPYSELAMIAPYAVTAQLKVRIKREEADLARVVKILTDAGYSGFIALEYEERTNPQTEIPKYLEKLKKIIRDVG